MAQLTCLTYSTVLCSICTENTREAVITSLIVLGSQQLIVPGISRMTALMRFCLIRRAERHTCKQLTVTPRHNTIRF